MPPKPIARRKTRVPKLHMTAAASSLGDSFAPTDAEWTSLEQVYCPLSKPLREQIAQAGERYLRIREAEMAAPLLPDALKYIGGLLAATDRLRALQANPKFCSEAKNVVDAHIRAHLSETGRTMEWVLYGWPEALKSVRNDLTERAKKNGFLDGGAWEHLVNELISIFELQKLPIQITAPSSNQSKLEKRTASKFVRFFFAFEGLWKDRWPRRNSTEEGLTKALKKARKHPGTKISIF